MRFRFIGDFISSSRKPLVEEKTVKGNPALSLNFGVRNGNDTAFVEAFGSKQDTIAVYKNRERTEISWEERKDPDVIKDISLKYIINMGTREEFVSQYDQIERLREILTDYSGRICVTGDVRRRFYNGKWYDSYSVRNVYLPKEDEKNGLNITAEIIFNKDSVDRTDYEKGKTLTVNGYTEQYIDKENPKALVPTTFTMSVSRLDSTNPKHALAIKVREMLLFVKGKDYYKMGWECVLKNGAEEVEFSEADLTDIQKMLIEAGECTLEDCRPTGQIFGERKTELRLKKPMARAPYDNGNVEYGTEDEVEDMIYHPPVSIASSSSVEDDLLNAVEDVNDLFA